jgi:CheY-like chemotaxis protein
MVHGIVAQSGGHIDVESQPGQGATFRFYLPATAARVQAEASATPPTGKRGTGTILLVENQAEVRLYTAEVLRESGYQVMLAASGEEALSQSEGQTVDLLLTDVVMPKMNGWELAQQVRLRRPETKVLFMSGYSEEMLVGQSEELRAAALIQKPFAPGALVEKVRETLGRVSDPRC